MELLSTGSESDHEYGEDSEEGNNSNELEMNKCSNTAPVPSLLGVLHAPNNLI